MSILMPQQALSMVLEYLINQALHMNNASNSTFVALEQKTLVLHLAELNFPLAFTCTHQLEKIVVSGNIDSADCTITTSIKALKKIKENHALTQAIKEDLLDIEGDLKIAQLFMAMAESIDIDWQSELAKNIGDVPTYKLQQVAYSVSAKINFAKKQIEADTSEWLVHEKKLVVTTRECQHLITEINNITEHVNHLSLRIQSIEQALMQSQKKA